MTDEAPVWFSARLVLQSVHEPAREGIHLFEDRIILVRAADEETAQQKAWAIGSAQKERYENIYGEKVQWVLREVIDIKRLFEDEITEGTEVYYSFLNDEELDCLRRSLQPHD